MISLAKSLGFPNLLFEANNHNSGKQQFEELITISNGVLTLIDACSDMNNNRHKNTR